MTTNQQLSYGIEDVVKATSLSRSRVYLAIGSGELRSFKTGKRRMVSAAALREWITSLEQASNGGRKQA